MFAYLALEEFPKLKLNFCLLNCCCLLLTLFMFIVKGLVGFNF